MRNCPACGASAPADASWCGQCYAPLSGVTPAPPAVSALVPELALAGGAGAYAAAPGYPLAPASRPAEGPAVGAMLSRRAVTLVAVAIGIGAIGMGISYVLGQNDRLEPATYLRYALMLTLGVYVIVGALLVTQLVPGIRLRWTNGSPATGVLVGAGVGGVISAVLLSLVSSASGHLAPDPRIVTLMSEGDVGHIAVTIAITCLCAPLIEEILFRGLLLESLRGKGLGPALSLSGLAFAVWHLNPAALKYYALMGILFGFLYVKRGLVCSMAAHFTFNGVLAVAALAVVLSPGKTFTASNMSIHAPSGWSQHNEYDTPSSALALEGPSGAGVIVFELPTPVAVSPDMILNRLQTNAWQQFVPNVDAVVNNARPVHLPAGSAVEADITADGHSGNLVFVPEQSQLVGVIFISAGSEKAKTDFPHMLDSLRVG